MEIRQNHSCSLNLCLCDDIPLITKFVAQLSDSIIIEYNDDFMFTQIGIESVKIGACSKTPHNVHRCLLYT